MDADGPDSGIGFLEGGGRMGALMRAHDWSSSPLGPPSRWPDVLKTAIGTCLSSQFPMVVWWGPDLLMFYNDAWQPILGETKHPGGLGRPGRDSWPETWPLVGKQFEDALQGEASWSEDLLLASDRHGFMQECYFTYSHSPLRAPSGEVVGVFSAVKETTTRVLNERRMRLLTDLSNATLGATTGSASTEAVCQQLLDVYCAGNPDAPFAVLYLLDRQDGVRRAGAAGIEAHRFPEFVDDADDPWGVRRALATSSAVLLDPVPGPELPGGSWPEPTRAVITLPLRSKGEERHARGVLVAGLNPRLHFDKAYRSFLDLVAGQFASAIVTLEYMESEKRAASSRELLVRELQHRTRNLLALVQSISERTLQGSASMDAYAREFNGRLGALARIQGVLSREDTAIVSIGELIELEIGALTVADRSRVQCDGPIAPMPRQAVQLFAMALHELFTNAVKHGALRNGNAGNLAIRWDVRKDTDGKHMARIDWTERGGAVDPKPTRTGFGRMLLEKGLPLQLGGSTLFELRKDGLDCTLELPLAGARR